MRNRLAIGGALAVAAASLLLVRVLSYDTWGWLIWGREIVGSLPFVTEGYPSWKPLVGLIAVPLAPLGDAGPLLWLVIARFSALLSVLFAYRLGRRVAGPPAGALAALCLLVVPEWLFQAGVAGSEPLLTALLLIAVERHADRHDGSGFTLVFLASLLRPETWPFLLVSGAVTWRRRPRIRPLVVAGLALVPLLWFGGEYLGSGDPFRGGQLATQSHEARVLRRSGTFPPLAVLRNALSTLPPALLACIPFALWRAVPRQDPILLTLALGGLVWVLEVAVLAALGYAGVTRFLLPAAAALLVVGASGVVLLLRWPKLGLGIRVALAVGLAALAATSVPRIDDVRRQAAKVEHRADLEDSLTGLVSRVGRDRLRHTPHLSAEGLVVTQLAWRVGVLPGPLHRVGFPGLRIAAHDRRWAPFWRLVRSRRDLTARATVRVGPLYLISIQRRRGPSAPLHRD